MVRNEENKYELYNFLFVEYFHNFVFDCWLCYGKDAIWLTLLRNSCFNLAIFEK